MVSASVAALLAMSLPGVAEKDHFGSRSFRVNGKIFAQVKAESDRALVKVSAANQDALMTTDPETFQPAPSWGRYGWTYVLLPRANKRQLESLLRESYDQVRSPRRGTGARRLTTRSSGP